MAIFFLMSCSGLAVQVRKVQTSLASCDWVTVAIEEMVDIIFSSMPGKHDV